MDIEGTDDEKALHFFKTDHRRHPSDDRHHSVGIPQSPFQERVGLDSILMNHAIEMNDANKSFDKIANYIEEELL